MKLKSGCHASFVTWSGFFLVCMAPCHIKASAILLYKARIKGYKVNQVVGVLCLSCLMLIYENFIL